MGSGLYAENDRNITLLFFLWVTIRKSASDQLPRFQVSTWSISALLANGGKIPAILSAVKAPAAGVNLFSGSFFCNHFIFFFVCHQEQLRHKVKFNLVKFDSRVQAWRDRLVDCNTHVCISICVEMNTWDSRIWTTVWNSFSANIMIVAVMSATWAVARGRPEFPVERNAWIFRPFCRFF